LLFCCSIKKKNGALVCSPFEIKTVILSQVTNQNDLLHCVQTCKEWKELARKYFHQHVLLPTENKAASFISTITKSPDTGCVVISLKLHATCTGNEQYGIDAPTDYVKTVAKFCPNM
jgi:hypothetical protein